MAPHASSMHVGEWCAYERPCRKAESNPLNDDDIQIGNSPDQDDCSESLASSSSCFFSSTDMSKESTSTSSSSTSDISLCNIPDHTSWNANHQEFPGGLRGTPLMPSYQYGNVEDCVDPQLMASDSIFAHNWRAVDNGGWTVMGQAPSREATLGKGCRDSQMPACQNMRQQNRNDFDIAFDEMTVKVPSSEPGARMWLHTWVAMNPDRFPAAAELESLKILSGLSDSEIMEWLNRHVSVQLDSETEPIFRRQVETPRPISVPRYRPKCRRSRRRFRYIAEIPDETRIYECTHRCGQSFHKKGQWTRHERYNVEEWRCHLCTFVSARKDKLLKHLRESHNLRGSTRKSHCQQLLEPVARPCGFCLKQFDDWTLWLNHVCAHFEGQIAGGPWTMARWDETLIQGLGSDEGGDDDDDDDDDNDDEDHNGNDEDPTDPDCDSSAADEAGGRPSKGKGASYGHGSRGSSRSSGISKSASPGNGAPKPYQRGGNESLYCEQDTCTAQCANLSGMPTETRLGASRMFASVSEKDRRQVRGTFASDFTTLQSPSDAAADIMGVNGPTPFRETTSSPRRVRMCRLQPQPPTDPLKFRILPAGHDTRLLGNNASDVNIAADKSADGLQERTPRAGANFPKTRLGKLDLPDDPNPPIYHDDVPVLSTQGLIASINPPYPNSPTHRDGPPSPTTTVGPKASIGKRSVFDVRQCAAQSLCRDRSYLSCWRKEWTCAQNNKDQTTKSWQGTRNLSRNDNHQDAPDQIIRSTLDATAIKSPNDYPYTMSSTKCYELNAPSRAPHEAAFASESGLRLDLINTVIAVMGMTGVGKSTFIRMLSKQIILDHSRIDFDAVHKHSLPDRSNGYTHSPTPSSPISLLRSCLIYSSGFGATYRTDAEILCEFNLPLARYERSFRLRVEDGSKLWIAQHPLVYASARSNAFLPAVGRAKCSSTALRPGRASFDTIRRLYGVKDRAHLARFKLDRYLNDHSSGCYPETFEGSSECDAFEESKEIFDERHKEGLLQVSWGATCEEPNTSPFAWRAHPPAVAPYGASFMCNETYLPALLLRHGIDARLANASTFTPSTLEIWPAIDGDSFRVADFASAPGIPGASRRGRKKRCEEMPQEWPI